MIRKPLNFSRFPRSVGVAGICAWLGLATVLLCTPAQACPVPVFRYALENWVPATYEVAVLHRAPLSAAEGGMVQTLTAGAQAGANLQVHQIDVSTGLPEAYQKAWDSQAALPGLVILHGDGPVSGMCAWSGPLDAADAGQILSSPARTELARRLLKGQSIVWVLLQTGHKDRDDALAHKLEAALAEVRPGLAVTQEAFDAADASGPPLRIEFSMLPVARQDPAERVFSRMLLSIEPGLSAVDGPVVIPVFGRGRAMGAIHEEDLDAETIAQCTRFLCGACSCLVKEQNPGVDLLIAANWAGAFGQEPATRPVIADLPGPALFAATAPATMAAPAVAAALPPVPPESNPLRRNLLAAVGFIAVAGIALAIIAGRRKGRT